MFVEDACRIREIVLKDTAFKSVANSSLDAAVLRLSQTQSLDGFRLESMRTLALANNGHTRAIANAAVQTWAIRFVWLADGPCVVEGSHAGARLLAVNDTEIPHIFASLRPYLAGTDQRARALAGFMLAWPPAISVATGVEGATVYRLRRLDGNIFNLTASELAQPGAIYPFRERGVAHTLIARAGIASLEEAQFGTFLRQFPGQIAYVRIADLGTDPVEVIAAKLAAISVQIRTAQRLVVDLRGNPGGDFFGTAAFARGLKDIAPGATLAVVVDKFTFSAAVVTAALLKFHARGRLVGEEMGDGAAFHAEGGTEVLPDSGLSIRHSNGWHDWGTGRAEAFLTPPEIAQEMIAAGSLLPEVAASPTGEDFSTGRDAALESALALFRE